MRGPVVACMKHESGVRDTVAHTDGDAATRAAMRGPVVACMKHESGVRDTVAHTDGDADMDMDMDTDAGCGHAHGAHVRKSSMRLKAGSKSRTPALEPALKRSAPPLPP